MRLRSFACFQFAALFLAASARGADDPAQFRFHRQIELPARTQESLVAVPLDSDVYAETKNGLVDLRIVGADGGPVAFLFRKQVETRPFTTRRNWQARDLTLKPRDAGGLEIRFGLNDGEPGRDPSPRGLRFFSPLRNFEQRVQVFGIDAGGAEQPLVRDALLFDYSQYMDVSHNEIALPENAFRKFRIEIGAVTSDQESQLLELTRRMRSGKEEEREVQTTIQRRPFRIDRIELFRDETRTSASRESERPYPVVRFQVENDGERKQTVITVETRREPLVEFQLKTSSRNFSRRVSVQVPETREGRTSWKDIASSTISRFELPDLKTEELRVQISERRHQEFHIVIDNRDSPPLEITGVEALGHRHELMILAAADQKYQLQYGSADLDRLPDYDTAALALAMGRGNATLTAKLGVPVGVDIVAKPLTARNFLDNPVLIGALIAVLVGLLGWSLYYASQRIEQLPPDEP